jgi:hypothetical protein
VSRAARWVAAAALAACGDNGAIPVDGGRPVDAMLPPDPFAGMYTSPADFPRTGCRAGAFAG